MLYSISLEVEKSINNTVKRQRETQRNTYASYDSCSESLVISKGAKALQSPILFLQNAEFFVG